MAFCDFCQCDTCQNGSLYLRHAQTEDDTWICDVCYDFDLCTAPGVNRANDPCPNANCIHRPKIIGEWLKFEEPNGLNSRNLMADQEKKDLEEFYHFVQEWDKKHSASWGACTAELVDENDPDGYVVIKDSKGCPRLWLPREDFEAFQTMKDRAH